MEQVGIVILNYNNVVEIKKCINSILLYCDFTLVKCVIVDNGSKSELRDAVHIFLSEKTSSYKRLQKGAQTQPIGFLADITYLCLPKNEGYARGNNEGIEFLYGFNSISHILILNSDIVLTEDIIKPLLYHLSQLSNVGCISPLLYKSNGEIDHCCARKNYPVGTIAYTFSYLFANRYRKLNAQLKILKADPSLLKQRIVEIELPSGSCMLFEKATLQKIGGFDPETFLYYEESILSKKLLRIGKTCYLVPTVSCIHIGGSTTNSQQTSYFLKQCNYKSVLYYLKTYEPQAYVVRFYVILTGQLRLLRLYIGELYHALVD